MALDLTGLQALKPKTQVVDLSEFQDGAEAYVREFTAGDRQAFWRMWKDSDGQPDNIHARMLAMTVCDKDGTLLAEKWEDFQHLPLPVTEKLFEAAKTLNGMDDDSEESTRKNSETTPPEDSTTA